MLFYPWGFPLLVTVGRLVVNQKGFAPSIRVFVTVLRTVEARCETSLFVPPLSLLAYEDPCPL